MSAPGTPGPWGVGPSHVVRFGWYDQQGRRCTGWIAECVGEHPPGEIEANANLIAAAPLLYEGALDTVIALKLLRLGLADNAPALEMIDAHVDELEYALAKARGES